MEVVTIAYNRKVMMNDETAERVRFVTEGLTNTRNETARSRVVVEEESSQSSQSSQSSGKSAWYTKFREWRTSCLGCPDAGFAGSLRYTVHCTCFISPIIL
jgi:hypothetical protein